jgi:predicted phage tail protein
MKDVRDGGNVDESRFPGHTQPRRLGRWLRAFAGICLALIMVGGSTMVAGGIAPAASAHVFPAAPSDQCQGPSITVVTSGYCPGAPTLLAATAGNGTVTLSWAAPASDGGPEVTGYNVYRGTSPGGETGPVNGSSLINAPSSSYTVTDLTNGIPYYFTVTAVIVIDEGLASDEGPASNEMSATPATMPGPPLRLIATPSDGTVTLTWAAPRSDGGSPVSGYNVYHATSPDFKGATEFSGVKGAAFVLAGLVNGTPYYFRVTAVNEAGEGKPSKEASAIPLAVPGVPTGLAATPGNGMVTLSWAAPASDGGSQISGYNVYQGTSPGGETGPVNGSSLITATSYKATGLVNGTTYYFQVAAVNAVGQGPSSAEAQAVPVTVPGAPAGLTATAGNGQVTLSWAAPTSDGGSPVTSYKVDVATTANFKVPTSYSAGTGTAVTVPGLVNGTTYYFRVAAVNRAGEGDPSNAESATPLAVPGAPAGLAATAGNGTVTLSWAAPASDGGSRVTGYNVYQGTKSGGETRVPVNGSLVTGTSFKATGLVNGTTYYFRVAAVNAEGQGPSSAEAQAVPVTVPGAPVRLTVSPSGARVTLSWAAPTSDGGSPVTGYNVFAATSADFKGAVKVTGGTGTAVTVTGLVNGTTYYFRVTAVNQVGEGPASGEAQAVPATVPGAPVRLTATPGKSKVTLTWVAPASGGSPITGYIIYKGTSSGGETGPAVNASPVTATSYTVTGLVNGTTYFEVFAVNAVGQGPSSEALATLSLIVPPTPPTPPIPPTPPASSATPPTAPAFPGPTGLTATAGDTKVHLSWTAPASDGGSPVTSYKVYLATTPDAQQSTTIATAKSADATVTHLVNGTTYYFMVTAVNTAGHESPFSTEVSAEPAKLATQVKISPDSPTVPPQLIALITAAAAMAVAGVFTLITRGRSHFRSRKRDRSEHSRDEMDVGSDVRAVADTVRPGAVHVRDTGQEPTHTVRLEPHSGVSTTTIKEGRP